eukprot:GHVS01036642.1.p1 GENE.GHVS01036642.1~~GHVS01036642.1.p1  ORF type:complete len:175 (+),score=13.23 GHVS01036642.1:627-1151(+)
MTIAPFTVGNKWHVKTSAVGETNLSREDVTVTQTRKIWATITLQDGGHLLGSVVIGAVGSAFTLEDLSVPKDLVKTAVTKNARNVWKPFADYFLRKISKGGVVSFPTLVVSLLESKDGTQRFRVSTEMKNLPQFVDGNPPPAVNSLYCSVLSTVTSLTSPAPLPVVVEHFLYLS